MRSWQVFFDIFNAKLFAWHVPTKKSLKWLNTFFIGVHKWQMAEQDNNAANQEFYDFIYTVYRVYHFMISEFFSKTKARLCYRWQMYKLTFRNIYYKITWNCISISLDFVLTDANWYIVNCQVLSVDIFIHSQMFFRIYFHS